MTDFELSWSFSVRLPQN